MVAVHTVWTYPAPGDRLIIPLLAVTEDDLGHDAITEHDQDESAKELRQRLAEETSYAWPSQP